MAKVPLRLYIREIENLIDRGQTEEALAHCKYILETYPKCIDIYRLLGKAYLETQRYSEAADILQRVLSSVPDDFVSQVGMSIIREDEGDLNAAVWHMERAYESQPSNGAVQEELRRLYGRRDGSEPPKIRMTRGALVRMYARGHLYEQAIAEVRAALDEDPQRSDLQVLLAKLYAQTGARVEATALCSELISKFPYSFEANRILSEILPGSTHANDVQTYRQRVIDLDPYMEFATVDKPVVEVADQEVILERLEWEPGHGETAQPSWASTIGISLDAETSDEHVLPDWLASLSSVAPMSGNQASKPEPQSFSPPPIPNISSDPARRARPAVPGQSDMPLSPEQAVPASEANMDLPEWMKDAGWSSANGQAHEEAFAFDPNQDSGEAIMNTDLPDWLQTLAPEQDSDVSDGDVAEAAEQFAWLEDISKAKSSTGGLPLDKAGFDEKEDRLQSAPEPRQDAEPVSAKPETAEPVLSGERIPSWLNEVSDSNPVVGLNPNANTPEIPDWVNAAEPEPVDPGPSEELPQFTHSKEDTMAWLEELASQHNSEAPTMIIRPGQRVSQPPSWIDEQPDDLTPSDFEPQTPKTPASAPQSPEIHSQSLTPAEKGHVESLLSSINETIPVPKGEPLPYQGEPDQTVQPAEPEAVPAEEFPAWLVDLAQPAAAPQAPQTPAHETAQPADRGSLRPAPQPEDSTRDDEKAAMAWLDQLSITPAEEPEIEEDHGLADLRQEVASAWKPEDTAAPQVEPSEAINAADQPAVSSAESASTPADAASPSLELPDWLKMIDQPQEETEAPALPEQFDLAKTEADLETWLQENAAPPDTPTSPAFHLEQPELAAVAPETEMTPAAPPPVEEEMPAWLQDLDHTVKDQEPVAFVQPTSETTSTDQPEEEIPLWLQEFAPSVPSEVSPQSQAAAMPEQHTEPMIETIPSAQPVDASLPLAEVTNEPQAEVYPSADVVPEAPVEPIAEIKVAQPAELTPQPAASEAFPVEEPAPLVSEPQSVEIVPVFEMKPEPPVSLEDTVPVRIAEPVQTAPLPEAKPAPVEPVQPPAPAAPIHMPSIAEAQAALRDGQFDTAMAFYDQIIHTNDHLEEAIHNLREALYQYPVEIALWQTLGDAFMRSNQLQEAIDAYTKAEELIR
jgi:tetratricopeptide (TPR) repeat protein